MSQTSAFIDTLFTSVWGILLVVVFFNGSIVIHELGHYLAARWRGLKVERFSLFGLGPKLVSWHGRDGVEYCICAIPFGAYVALPQLADMRALEGDSEEPVEALPPITYADKMYVAFAGPLFNLILALIIALAGWWTGYPSEQGSESPRIGYVMPAIALDETTEIPGPAAEAGLRPGDVIVAIDGDPIHSFKEVSEHVALGSGRDAEGKPQTVFTIERDGQTEEVVIHPALYLINEASGDRLRMIGIQPTNSMVVATVMPNSPAERAGLRSGDELVRIAGERVYSIAQISDLLNARSREKVEVEILRNGQPLTLTAEATPVPQTKPLGRLYLPGSEEPAFEIIPGYAPGETDDLSRTDTPSRLDLFSLEAGRGIFDSDGDWAIASVDGQPVTSLAALKQIFAAASDEASFQITLMNHIGVTRERTLPADCQLEIVPPFERVMLGFSSQADYIMVHPDPLTQFREHIDRTFRTLGSLLNPQSNIGLQHLSGPVGITTSLYRIATFDWRMALWFAVLLNINLAILNLLPIPVLDGGHMLIATIGKLRGKPLPGSLIASVQGMLMLLLLGVMVYVLFFDSMREVGYHQEKKTLERQEHYGIPPEFRADRPAQ